MTSFFFFFRTLLLSSVWTSRELAVVTGDVTFSPVGSCFQFLSRIAFSNPTARRCLIESVVANSRSRAFRKSICAQEKVPANFYEHALGGVRTHETDLYQARG